MQLPNGIEQHGANYRIRIRVPRDVKAEVGRDVVRETIRETDRHRAVAAGMKRLAELAAEWDRLRKKPLTDTLRAELAAEFGADQRAYEDGQTLTLPSDFLRSRAEATLAEIAPTLPDALHPATLDVMQTAGAADYERDRRERLAAVLRVALDRGEAEPVAWAAREFIARHNLTAPEGGAAYASLCEALTVAWLGVLAPEPAKTQAPCPPIQSPAPDATPSGTILERFAAFEADNPRGVSRDQLNLTGQCIRLFASFMPEGFPAAAITKRHVREWKAALRFMPIKASERRELKGLRMREAIERNKTLGRPVISAASVNRYLNNLSAFCDWLVKGDELPANPVTGMRDRLDKRENKPDPYTSAELQRLFTSPLFTGFDRDGREHLPGLARADDWRTWLPLVALFTGARLSEIAQLLVDDVREEAGHWCVHITDMGGKALKTTASRRVIPVHPELARVGFLAFVERMRGRGVARLFPTLLPDTRGQFGGKPSKWFGRYFARAGVKADKSRNFHSLRHGMADALREAGFLDAQAAIILGHAKSETGMTRGYGKLREGDLKTRVEMISAVRFHGLDLSHLHP